MFVLLHHVGQFARLAPGSFVGSFGLSSPVVVVLAHGPKVRLECVDLVGHLRLRLRRIGLRSLEEGHPHGSLTASLLETLDFLITLLNDVSEACFLFR